MKKGFTLIELLAVIVILAIIALIATPIVLNIINDTKESASLRSAEMYLRGVEQSIMREKMNANGSFNPNYCEVKHNGDLICDKSELIVEVKGERPTGGNIVFKEGKMIIVNLESSGGKIISNNNNKIEYTDKSCYLGDIDADKVADIGEVITCAKEKFYVIENKNNTISMLAKYNLDAGYVYSQDDWNYIFKEDMTGKQLKDTQTLVEFSTNSWWQDGGFVYKSNVVNNIEQSVIYPYLNNYEKYLISNGVATAKATLISIEQLQNLGCEIIDITIADATCKNALEWIRLSDYWTGSAWDSYAVWQVSYNQLNARESDMLSTGVGIRPVINISVNEI